MKIYIATYDRELPEKSDFNNGEHYCFLSEKDAQKDINENWDGEGYILECEIKSIKATFPPTNTGKLYKLFVNNKKNVLSD